MQILETYKQLLEEIQAEVESYEKRPTKACSLRIRKLSNQIGKEGKFLRADLLAADKDK